MSKVRRIVLVRHGETEGESSVRFHGATDVALDATGRQQMEKVARELADEPFSTVVASPLQRSWRAAWIVGGGAPVRIESGLREVDFGRWEGLTAEEIKASDPVLYEDWTSGAANFQYPNGESTAAFRGRVECALEGLLALPAHSLLIVAHKGVLRAIAGKLLGSELDKKDADLGLGGVVTLTRKGNGEWYRGTKSSNPPGLEDAA